MPRTKSKASLWAQILTCENIDDVIDVLDGFGIVTMDGDDSAIPEEVTEWLSENLIGKTFGIVTGSLDAYAGTSWAGRAKGISIKTISDAIEEMELNDVKACTEGKLYRGRFDTVESAIVALQAFDNEEMQETLTGLKAVSESKFSMIREYVQEQAKAEIIWEESK